MTHVYTQLILFSFSDLHCKIIRSCFCHQLYLAWRCWTFHTIMLCFATSIEKVTYRVLMEIISATMYFSNFLLFRLELVKLLWVPVHHSSFGPSTHILVYISFCEWCLKAPLHSHTCLKVTYRVLMEIMSATIDLNLFFFSD